MIPHFDDTCKKKEFQMNVRALNKRVPLLKWGSLFLLWAIFAAPLKAEVVSPWVSTDRTVDCSSFDTIIRDLKIKEMKTEEEKALALYYFFRQRVFHYPEVPGSRDPIKNLNCLGFTLCGSQATCMKGLLEAAGIKVRVVSSKMVNPLTGKAQGSGHTYYEAFYDDKWHGFDTMCNFFIYTRGEKKEIASFEELAKDPTLVADAVKENRACLNMCPCGDDPMGFCDKTTENDYKPLKLKYDVKSFSLRQGEEIVRSWWPDGKPLAGSYKASRGPGPIHGCGTKDRKGEPFLFKFWEPYGLRKPFSELTESYRHYASGQINYAPDLTSTKYKDGLLTDTGVAPSADGLSGQGEISFQVKSPYYISGAVLYFEATCPGEGDSVVVSAGTDKTKLNPLFTGKDPEKKQYQAVLDAETMKKEKAEVGNHLYFVKIALTGKTVLHHFYLRTAFQYNAMAVPHLMPGKNKVTVEVGNGDALKTAPVTLVYRYREAPKWSDENKIEKTISESPFSFEETLPDTGEKIPQMLDLTLRCGTLAWTPADSAEKSAGAPEKPADAPKKSAGIPEKP